MYRRPFLAAIAIIALSGCRLPDDTAGTLDRVESGTLRVGLLEAPDALEASGEAAAIARLAEALGATPELVPGGTHDLVHRLDTGQIDLLAGAIPDKTPLETEMALTRPWGRIELAGERREAVFGVRKGEHAMLYAVDRALDGAVE